MTFRDLLEGKGARNPKTKKADGSHVEEGLKAKKVKESVYNKYLNQLAPDKRAYLDDKVEADEYYLAFEGDKVVGGFGVNYNGYLTGLFGIEKGYGKRIFKLRLKIAGSKVKGSNNKLNLFCTGNFLRDLYKGFGFKVTNTLEWDDEYAPDNWDYEKSGRPKLYEMSL